MNGTAPDPQERIRQAISGDDEGQRRIAVEGLKWLATLLKKNADYGSSVWNPPALRPDMKAGDAIMVRMSDKVSRIGALSSREAEIDESLEDSVRELGGYCLLGRGRPPEGEGK